MSPSSLTTESLTHMVLTLRVLGALLPILGGILVLAAFLYDRELRIRQRPRELSAEQAERFRTFLRESPGRFIPTLSPAGDREAEELSEQLANILNSEGWEAGNTGELVRFTPAIEGIIISVRHLDSVQPHASILHRAFEAVGMPAKIAVDDRAGEPPIQLFVGHKPSR